MGIKKKVVKTTKGEKAKKETRKKRTKKETAKGQIETIDHGQTIKEVKKFIEIRLKELHKSGELAERERGANLLERITQHQGLIRKLKLSDDSLFALVARQQGSYLLKLKESFQGELSDEENQSSSWKEYLEAMVPGLSQRSCEERMTLSRRVDIEPLLFLGYKELVRYCSATTRLHDQGMLDQFVERFNLDPDESKNSSAEEYAQRVKNLLPVAKLKGLAPKLKYKYIRKFLQAGGKVSGELAKQLKEAKGAQACQKILDAHLEALKDGESPSLTQRHPLYWLRVNTERAVEISDAVLAAGVELKGKDLSKVKKAAVALKRLLPKAG